VSNLSFFVYEEDGVRSAINLNRVVSSTLAKVDGKLTLVVAMSDGQARHLHADFIGNFYTALGPLDAKRFGKPGG
jgi:hypothetical protein